MYFRLVLPIVLIAAVSCKDLELGQNVTEARKIFDEKKEASPAVWRQVDKITVNTTDAEVISRVVVTDLRPNKDGEANIVDGGEGNQTVTIELKSPTVLRGYEFHIEVYAAPDTAGNKPQDVSTPGKIGNDKPKDQWKPSEDDLRLNIGDVKPPSTFGADSTKPPVPLLTDVKVNDGKRITRDSEMKKEEEALNHPITFVDPKESTESDLGKKIPTVDTKEATTGLRTNKPQKDVESSTHLPTAAGLKKDEHVRHVRDTEKKTQSTTQAPTTFKATKDSKDSFVPDMVYPQWNIDKSGNTDKLLIPGELEMGHDTKEVKSVKDSTLIPTSTTTTTVKPRAVRDTEVTTSKTDVKGQDDKHVQKIPASGLVTIPKEWTDLHNSTIPKTDMKSKVGDSEIPQPTVPKIDLNSKNVDSKILQPTAPKTDLKNNNEDTKTSQTAITKTDLNNKNGESKTAQTPALFPTLNHEPTKNGPTMSTTTLVNTRHPTSSEESDSAESSEHVKPVGFTAPKNYSF